MNNTDRLIQSLECAIRAGQDSVTFMVGRYTGNGPAVVAALRRRGFIVSKVPAGRVSAYRLQRQAGA